MIKDALISTIQMTTFDTINTYLFKKFTEWDDIQSASIIEIMKKHSEEKIKEMSKATIRCIPLGNKLEAGKCILTGNPSIQRVVFARAY